MNMARVPREYYYEQGIMLGVSSLLLLVCALQALIVYRVRALRAAKGPMSFSLSLSLSLSIHPIHRILCL